MRVIFKDGHDELLRTLFKAVSKDKEPLCAQHCIDLLKISKSISGVKKSLTGTQKLMLSLQSDYVLKKGPRVNPLIHSHAPQRELSEHENVECLKKLAHDHKIPGYSTSITSLLKRLLPLDCEEDVLFAIQFLYTLLTLGTGELNEEFVPALAN